VFGVEAGEQDAGRIAVLDVGGGDEQVDEQAVLVNQEMPLPPAVSSAMALLATAGRRRKSVVTTAATASSVARSWIASTFSWTLSGESTFQPTTRFALSCVHLGCPPRGLGGGLVTASNRSCSSGMLARILWMVCETSARRRSFGQREDTHR